MLILLEGTQDHNIRKSHLIFQRSHSEAKHYSFGWLSAPSSANCISVHYNWWTLQGGLFLNQSHRVPKNNITSYYTTPTTTAIHATEASTSAMTMNLAPTLTLPIPLPHQQSSTAPHFDSKTPLTLCTYLLDYESLAEAAWLSPDEQLTQSTCYLNREDKDNWENLP